MDRKTLFFLFIFFFSCGNPLKAEIGIASYYADRFHGKKTASGKPYNKNEYTAAHKTLKFGTKVNVINTKNRRTVTVIINDRGPYVKNRIIDLSKAAAKKIGIIQRGIEKVKLEVSTTPP